MDNEGIAACNELEKEVFAHLKEQVFPTYAAISEELTSRRSILLAMQTDKLQLCLGDVCAFIRTDTPRDTGDVVCLFVASPVMNAYGQPVERLVWVCMEKPDGDLPLVKVLGSVPVNGIPMWISGRRTLPNFPSGQACNKGTLPCGTPYYVYRVALYADGFQQHKSLTDVRSVTGVYMLPLGLPLELRRSKEAPRVITLIPHQQDERK